MSSGRKSSFSVAAAPPLPPTRNLIATILTVAEDISDIFFSPMRPPQIRVHGRITTANLPDLSVIIPDDTRRIVSDLIGVRSNLLTRLEAEGSCDFSLFLQDLGRFRVSIFSQRGTYAIKLRVIPAALPSFKSLHLPAQMERLVRFRCGLVIVSGPAGSGKTSTAAALMNRINEENEMHIVTVEDPIEFLIRHEKGTVLQRELYRDVPSFSSALRTSLRHPPHVILLSALPDRETLDLTLEAADCGHLIFAELNQPDASRSIEGLLRLFPAAEDQRVRARLARNLRAVVSQRLIPRKDGTGLAELREILFSTPAVRECLLNGENGAVNFSEAIREGASEGLQGFESELRKLQQAGTIAADAGWEELFCAQTPEKGSGSKRK
ncbi:MAG: ATPase, T2SS/T4P/T4SS family [Candidatus Acidiferrales bacterium]